MSPTLTEKDAGRFATLKQVIKEGKAAFMAVCMALAQIHRDRLYRQDYLSFEAFCKEELGFTRQHGYRLIDFANQVEATPVGDTKPENEHQARKQKQQRNSNQKRDRETHTAEGGDVECATTDAPPSEADSLAASLGFKSADEAIKSFGDTAAKSFARISTLPKMLLEALDLAKEEIIAITDPDFDTTDCPQLHDSAKHIRKAANELDRYVKTVCGE